MHVVNLGGRCGLTEYPAARIIQVGQICPSVYDLPQFGPSSCPGRPPGPLLLPVPPCCQYLFLVHLVWILCQDLIRRWYLVTCEPIQRDTVSLFYHFATISHSADSGAPISPSLLLGQPCDQCGTGGPWGGIGLRGGRVSPSKNKSHTRLSPLKIPPFESLGQAQPLKPSIYQRISAFWDKPRN